MAGAVRAALRRPPRGRHAQGLARLAAAGYVVAAQTSAARTSPKAPGSATGPSGWGEQKDGYDTVEWLAKQPWCTGKVGTFGSSQAGFAQNFLAVTQPPHLTCQYMIDTGLSLFHEGYRIGGTTRPERFKQMDTVCRNPDDNRRLMEEWFRHPTYDDYWAARGLHAPLRQDERAVLHHRQLVRLHVPGLGRELHRPAAPAAARTRAASSNSSSAPGCTAAEQDATRSATCLSRRTRTGRNAEHMVRWFDHYLKGIDNGVEKDPTVRYYVMGAVGETDAPGNDWRNAADWPPATRRPRSTCSAGGKLSDGRPTADDRLDELPERPAPSDADPRARRSPARRTPGRSRSRPRCGRSPPTR